MSNGLITSFFSSVSSVNEPPTAENQDKGHDQECNEPEGNGLTVDLTGLLRSGGDDDKVKTKKKKKRNHGKKRGHVHLAKLSEEECSISLGALAAEEPYVCEEVTSMDLDDSIVLLSPLKQGSPQKKERGRGGGSLSESWKQVFSRVKKKSPIKKPIGSPKRCGSPRQSPPQRCRSPRQPLVQKQTKRSSPLKKQHANNMVKRQLLVTPSNKSLPLVDHAPFTGLVHVQQINQSANITNSMHHQLSKFPMRSFLPFTPQATTTSLGISDHLPHPQTTPLFEAVADPSLCLELLHREHPHLSISDIYSRYCSLTRGCGSDPGSYSMATDASLICSISVRVERDGKIIVNSSTHPKQPPLQDHMHSDLWSSVYRPRNSGEVLGNGKQCAELCTWLKRWRNDDNSEPASFITGREREMAQRKHRKGPKVSEWWEKDCDEDFVPPEKVNLSKGRSGLCQRYLSGDGEDGVGEEEEEDGEETSVMLLCGPHGAGKTAAVYASAEELGFRVFEVNSSTARGRSQVLASLREVTLSHLVAQRKRNGLNHVVGDKQQAVALETNTLILLEDVDVLFEDQDRGFWSAVYEIIQFTKRPFVITCSDTSLELSCPHTRLIFSQPKNADLALHIRLLSLAHGFSLSSESANQIVASFNCDIRRTFHYMHMWLSWSPSNGIKAPPPRSSSHLPPLSLLADWRNVPSPFAPCPSTKTSANTDQLELLHSASLADHLATLDLLTSGTVDSTPWWRVAPDNHLLDELSETTSSDAVVAQTKYDIVAELNRLPTPALLHQNQGSYLELHGCLKTATQAFSLNWRLARVAIATEGIPFLRLISIIEEQRRSSCAKRRFHHHLQHSSVTIHDLNVLASYTFLRQEH